MDFENLTLTIVLTALYARSLEQVYRPDVFARRRDAFADRRRAAIVAGARPIWYDGVRAGLELAAAINHGPGPGGE